MFLIQTVCFVFIYYSEFYIEVWSNINKFEYDNNVAYEFKHFICLFHLDYIFIVFIGGETNGYAFYAFLPLYSLVVNSCLAKMNILATDWISYRTVLFLRKRHKSAQKILWLEMFVCIFGHFLLSSPYVFNPRWKSCGICGGQSRTWRTFSPRTSLLRNGYHSSSTSLKHFIKLLPVL